MFEIKNSTDFLVYFFRIFEIKNAVASNVPIFVIKKKMYRHWILETFEWAKGVKNGKFWRRKKKPLNYIFKS